ncbi:CpsB/CapC family capsule biosynthesis tyrosine phosphatase [Anaerocolumna xylanovorans]|uniref:protein-tyrosine-phosphatase n=1 Tax=Anaerocolumna xylanovorans DSM 12503 TaxID=1121345 RepID=A0A1M7Y1M6_9FIRM|nr:CpsB/CapC family capsule biosynthesis tyrosine phosphatase [Anaerocolumna xylanovorans]SHO45722.1 protein-tyrosine phosphatase [Anaerocolumna xylanovorans DSM 12503]
MVDMHTHILPGIDDGASSSEEAIMMTEYLYYQKVTAAVCTPHFYPMEMTLEEFVKKRANAMEAVSHSKIELIAASETHLHRYLYNNNDLKPLCIENTSYLLIELPAMKSWTGEYMEDIDKLIGYYNVNPIIAHIDRYKPLMRNKKLLKKLKNMGCLLQMNTSAVIKPDTKRRALSLIENGYVDLLGSDCHNISFRPPVIGEARRIIVHKLGEKTWDKLMNNAYMIINSALNSGRSEHTE